MPIPNDLQAVAGFVANCVGSQSNFTGDKRAAARALIRKTYDIGVKAAVDGAAGTTTAGAGTLCLPMSKPGRVIGAKFIPDAALTANDTNYATLQLEKRDGLGGAAVVVASRTTQITGGGGNMAQLVNYPLVISTTVATTQFAAGAILTVSITKQGTGVAVPAGSWAVDIEEEGPDAYPV